MKILVGCEESQAVTKAFRKRGFEAYSCDTEDCSGGHPEWHIKGDVMGVLYDPSWSCVIGFPPCTYMSAVSARWLFPGGALNEERYKKAMMAKSFFMAILNAPVKYVSVENPTPLKVLGLPEHTQVIQPYQFGHPYSKRTLLWLRGLPQLKPTEIIAEHCSYVSASKNQRVLPGCKAVSSSKKRSKTFAGIAEAMAKQWGEYLISMEK